MYDFEKQLVDGVLIEKVNLLRATLAEANIMRQRLTEDIQLKNKKIIVDLSQCTFIDSTFLGALVVSLKKAKAIGAEIKLVISKSSPTEGILNVSGVLKTFDNYTSVEDAVISFRDDDR